MPRALKKMGLTNEDIEPPKNDSEYKPEEEKKKDSKAEKRKHFHALGPQMKKILRPAEYYSARKKKCH